jgi:hypothetical protein
LYYSLIDDVKRDGWIREASGLWILRFRYDWESWDQNPKVWIERGRLESNGIPLLKNRKRMSRRLAKKLRMELLSTGLRCIDPQWD